MDELVNSLYELFVKHEYRWSFDGVMRAPSAEEIKNMLGECHAKLQRERAVGNRVTIDSGKLMLRDVGSNVELWVYMGDYEDNM